MKPSQPVWRLRMGCGEALTAGRVRQSPLPAAQRNQRTRPAFKPGGGKP